ncbi:hypothetical protein [Phytomonospora endophytica]|uniref:Uncharacterized protein n=1 Tax=Phytomonospora endophytica TaxID=714109 RepID=A0A841FKI5_9ACTN|nr:hypothetical protein [Phytomonospora endophytica]MBB6036676.1 hypothetical protein [Phytomonospora endophytica]
MNLRWLLAVLIVLGLAAVAMPFLNPPPAEIPPTLVGVTAAPAEPIQISAPRREGPVDVQEPRPIGIRVYRPATGVPLGDIGDLEAAASILVRTYGGSGKPRLGPFVHRVVDGYPTVELANGYEDWTAVSTYVFAPGLIVEVTCMLADADPDDRLADCAATIDGLVFP